MSKNTATACFVFGASGHGKVVVDALRSSGRSVSYLVDDDLEKVGKQFYGIGVISSSQLGAVTVGAGIVAIGCNEARRRVALRLLEAAYPFSSVVHKNACVADSVEVGVGSVVFAGAVVNSDAAIGRHVIINTASSVDHDCQIGDFSHVAPGARVCGGVTIGESVLLGAGSIVLPGVTVASGAIVGAGAVVNRDVPEFGKVAGNPARKIMERGS